MGLSADEIRKFGSLIVKTSSKTIVKFGRTNGRRCVHVMKQVKVMVEDVEREVTHSLTFYDPTEWTYHPWNNLNKKKEAEPLAAV